MTLAELEIGSKFVYEVGDEHVLEKIDEYHVQCTACSYSVTIDSFYADEEVFHVESE